MSTDASGYFPFHNTTTYHEQGWAVAQNVYPYARLDELIALGDSLPKASAIVGTGGDDTVAKDIRDSSVSWIRPSPETKWIYDGLCVAARQLNKDFFGFDLNGVDNLQYTVYDADEKERPQYYDWHVDRRGRGLGMNNPRKLSMVLQLSDPLSYEGGDLILHNLFKKVVPKEKGLLFAFPSYSLHKVTPVTAGVRKTLVAWFCGPDFR